MIPDIFTGQVAKAITPILTFPRWGKEFVLSPVGGELERGFERPCSAIQVSAKSTVYEPVNARGNK